MPYDRKSTVLMVMDMQRDFCDRDGVFARHGSDVTSIEAMVPTLARVMQACKERRIPIVATKLTVLLDLDGRAMTLGHLNTLRPFLKAEGFREGSRGQEVIPQLPRPDYEVRKWGHSAMYLTELEKIIRCLGARDLVFTGIATNGVVEATARDAVAREFHVTTLRDCVTGYNLELHEASLKNLGFIGRLATSDEFLAELA
jgi:ureidoacrylate peracid hydrolase